MKRTIGAAPLLLGLAACVASGPPAGSAGEGGVPSKDELYGGAADGDDWCERHGWYGDGICDEHCPMPDPDCDPLTPVDGDLCADTCRWAADGECDDGGPGSGYDLCEIGTDCTDCGPRPAAGSCASVGEPCDGTTCCDGLTCDHDSTASTCQPPPGTRCEDTCHWAKDGECDDGGPGSDHDLCELGTDCTDCGPRATGCLTSEDCPSGRYCRSDDRCASPGECAPVPHEVCPAVITPYCGCDGVTRESTSGCVYDRFDHRGACDCRTDGCPSGQYCSYCWGSWSCIPSGARC